MNTEKMTLRSRIRQLLNKDIFHFFGARLQDWRERIFTIFFSSILLFGIVSLISSVKHAAETGLWLNVVLYFTLFILWLLMLFVKKIPFNIRAIVSSINFYVLGIIAFISVGPIGSAKQHLFTFTIVLTLLLGFRFGLLGFIMNFCAFVYASWVFKHGLISWSNVPDYSYAAWMTTGITFLFENLAVTIASGLLAYGAEKIIIANEAYVDDLTSKNAELYLEIEKHKLTQQQLKTALQRERSDHSAE